MLTRGQAGGAFVLAALGACGGRSTLESPIVELATSDAGGNSTTNNNTNTVVVFEPPSPVDAAAPPIVDAAVDAGTGVCPATPLLTAASTPLAPSVREVIAAGNEHTCFLTTDQVWCWGQNSGGELGDGTQASRARPTQVLGVKNAISIASGPAFDYGCWASRGSHTCALVNDGTVTCWGSNPVGDGSWAIQALAPAPVPGLANVDSLAIGGYVNCALLRDGSASCWGVAAQPVPAVTTIAGRPLPYISIAAGLGAFAIGANYTIWSWNVDSDYGVTTISTPQQVPSTIPASSAPYRITAGWGHQCVLGFDGSVWCWGFNTHGQVGDGTNTDRGAPVQVVGVSGAVNVIAGGRSTCALMDGGTVQCWGDNSYGQMGNGQIGGEQPTAAPVPNLDKIYALSGGLEHWCALRSDLDLGGSVWCWGGNETGQVGDGTLTTRASPVQVYP